MNDIEKSELDTQELQTLEKKNRKEDLKEWAFFRKKELIKNANIVKQLVIKSVKVQYRNSVIGIFWTILNPLLNMLVMYLVFSNMFGNRAGASEVDKATYALYLLCGNIVFNMMRTATVQSLPSLVHNRGLLTKNKISFNVFPLSCTLSALVNFAFSFIALLGVMFVVWLQPGPETSVFSPSIFMVLLMIPALFLFSYGMSLILSALYTFFRDILHFYNVFLTLWMYLTPIFYSVEIFDGPGFLSGFMRVIVHCNPMYYFVEYFRAVVYRWSAHAAVGLESLAPFPGWDLAVLYAIGLGTFLLGGLIFKSTKHRFIYNI